MNRLTLLRHGHAVAESSASGDAGRALSAAGTEEAREAGRRLAARFGGCDLLLVSTAARTRQTADALVAGGLRARTVRVERDLYLAGPAGILDVVRERSPGHDHVVVVGHNPGLSELTARLAGEPGHEGLGTAEWRSFEMDGAP